MISKRTRKR